MKVKNLALSIITASTLLLGSAVTAEELPSGPDTGSPDTPFGHLGASFGAFSSGRYEEALKEVNIVLESKDENAILNAHMQKGKILAAMKNYTEAIQEFSKFLEAAPWAEDGYLERSEAYKMTNDSEHAKADRQKGLLCRGIREVDYNQFPAAIKTFDEAQKEGLKNYDVYLWRGAAHLLNDEFQDARTDFTTAWSFKKDGEKYWSQRVKDAEYDFAHQVKDPKKKWAMACSAIQILEAKRCLKSLPGLELTPERVESEKKLLESKWKVFTKADLLRVVSTQIAKGESYAKSDKKLLAWHLSNAIYLIRQGFIAGYIREDEAWPLIVQTAKQIQGSFESWEKFGEAYMASRETTDKETFDKTKRPHDQAFRRLTMDPRSPWKEIRWDTQL